MNFITLAPEEFTKFTIKSPYRNFMQTVEIANLREQNGWTAYYFGVEKKQKIIAAALIVAKPTFLGKSTFYCPGGPMLDYEDAELVHFFFTNLKKYAKSHNGYLLHIEPNFIVHRYGRDGEELDLQKTKSSPIGRQKAVENLKNLGFTKAAPDNPIYHFVLELNNAREDELLASFKQNTRNLISRATRKGVKIRELSREELPTFKKITKHTSDRRHFTDRPLTYYEKMYDLFHAKSQVKFLIAEVDATPVAAAMFVIYGDEVIYLFSGSEAQYMKEYNAQYAIQWYMIKYALEHKSKQYNFYGIQGLPDPEEPGYGIYRFKKGFTTKENGRIIELLGAYELPLNQPFYQIHKLLSMVRHGTVE